MNIQKSFSGSKTIIYYTSNRENPEMEQKVIDDMLSKAGGMPIISVSQKPMDLGQNICIGDVGFSYLNCRKQILMAAKLATTEYVITAESDFLYPPEYFNFKPSGDNIYRYENVWIMELSDRKQQNFYRKRSTSDGAQIVKRKFLIDLLEKYLEPYPGWYIKNNNETDPRHSPYHRVPHTLIHGENPCISMKTGNGISLRTAIKEGPENIRKNLPYWGEVNDLINKFL